MLEKCGTEVDEDEVLEEVKTEVLILKVEDENYSPPNNPLTSPESDEKNASTSAEVPDDNYDASHHRPPSQHPSTSDASFRRPTSQHPSTLASGTFSTYVQI